MGIPSTTGNSLRQPELEQMRIPSPRKSSVSLMARPISRRDSLPFARQTGQRGLSVWKWSLFISLSSYHHGRASGRQYFPSGRGDRRRAGRVGGGIVDPGRGQPADKHRKRSLDHYSRAAGNAGRQLARLRQAGQDRRGFFTDQNSGHACDDGQRHGWMGRGRGHGRRRMNVGMAMRRILKDFVADARSGGHG